MKVKRIEKRNLNKSRKPKQIQSAWRSADQSNSGRAKAEMSHITWAVCKQ